MNNPEEKQKFQILLNSFANNKKNQIEQDKDWVIRGFIDIYKNIYTISTDTKIVSKLLELHLFPHFSAFAEENGYDLVLASCQNYYPDMTFVSKSDPSIKFAVDLKTTYRKDATSTQCNGFTLGSHGEYFTDRNSTKNIQFPYSQYSGHFCFGIIYTRRFADTISEVKKYNIDQLQDIPAVIGDFIFFAQEKWKIASDKSGSGNTANIGSIKDIQDILNANGVFSKAGEEYFDDYWMNYGKITTTKNGKTHKITSFKEYIEYRKLSTNLLNEKGGNYAR